MRSGFQAADLIITGDRARLRRDGSSGEMPSQSSDTLNITNIPMLPVYASKLEAAYAKYLDALCHGGEIANWWYQPVSFRLPGKKNRYTPDFLTLCCRYGLTFIEVKGWSPSYDRSIVKLKTAAGLNPWARFLLVKRVKGDWEERAV